MGVEVLRRRARTVARPMPAVAPRKAAVGPVPGERREVLLRWMSDRETILAGGGKEGGWVCGGGEGRGKLEVWGFVVEIGG